MAVQGQIIFDVAKYSKNLIAILLTFDLAAATSWPERPAPACCENSAAIVRSSYRKERSIKAPNGAILQHLLFVKYYAVIRIPLIIWSISATPGAQQTTSASHQILIR
jgi:hypothetical protein